MVTAGVRKRAMVPALVESLIPIVAIVMTFLEYHFLATTDVVYNEMGNFQTFYSLIFRQPSTRMP